MNDNSVKCGNRAECRPLFDSLIFDSQCYGGISFYFASLIQGLIRLDPNYHFPYRYGDNYHLKRVLAEPLQPHFELIPECSLKGVWRLRNFFNRFEAFNTRLRNETDFLSLAKESNFDLIHLTYYRKLDFETSLPLVTTIHDMIYEKHPQFFSKNDKTSLLKRINCEQASKIIAVSETTKVDLINRFKIPEDKVRVIYHGFDPCQDSVDNLKHKCPQLKTGQFMFFNGNRKAYKNFFKFIAAVSPILIKEGLHLFCSGSSFDKKELEAFKKLGIEKHVFNALLNDAELKYVYQNCLFLVFPSIYEGFGIPLLEAMAYRCPMLLSNIRVFKEIAKDNAIYFDPYSVEDMREKVEYALSNLSELNSNLESGFLRYSDFSGWSQTFEKTYELYKQVAKQ